MFDAARRILLFLVGASLPIGGINLGSIGNFWVTPNKLLTAILLAFGLMQFVLTRRGPPRNPKTTWVLLFFASFTLSSFMGLAVNIPFSVIFIRFTTFVALVLYYFLLTYMLQSLRDVRVLLWALVVGGAISVVPAAAGLEQGSEAYGGTRYEGLSGQANIFGYDLSVCLPVAVALFFSSRSTFRRGLAVGAAMLAGVGIVFSLSRSAFVSLAGMWGLWVVRSGRVDSIKYVIPAILAIGGFLLFAPEDVQTRIETMTDPDKRAEDFSIQSRIIVSGLGLKAFVTHPIAGVGNYGWFVWVREQPDGHIAGNVHNVYLSVAAYQGLLGLIPFTVFLVMTWKDYNRTRRAAWFYAKRRDPVLIELGHYAMFLQIAFFGNLIGNIFSTSLDSKSQWLVIAFSTVLVTMARERVRVLESEETVAQDLPESDPYESPFLAAARQDGSYAR